MPITSVDSPSGWNIENGPPSSGLGSTFHPTALVSLTAPKPLAKHFKGRHFVGGRWVPSWAGRGVCASTDVLNKGLSRRRLRANTASKFPVMTESTKLSRCELVAGLLAACVDPCALRRRLGGGMRLHYVTATAGTVGARWAGATSGRHLDVNGGEPAGTHGAGWAVVVAKGNIDEICLSADLASRCYFCAHPKSGSRTGEDGGRSRSFSLRGGCC